MRQETGGSIGTLGLPEIKENKLEIELDDIEQRIEKIHEITKVKVQKRTVPAQSLKSATPIPFTMIWEGEVVEANFYNHLDTHTQELSENISSK